MIGVFLTAWVLFPALTLLLCAGAGLIVRRVTGPGAVPGLLVVPAGLALLVVIGGLLCYYAALAPLCAPAFAVVGVGGLLLERRALLARLGRGWDGMSPWPVASALGAWFVLAAPVVLSGKPGFTGYAHIVDISYEFDLAAHFPHSGRSFPGAASSAYQTVLAKYLGSGYPGGGTWTLGALSNLTPVDLSWLYQPFLAFLAAVSALSLYSLLGRLIAHRGWRALGAFVAAQPSVLVAYALGGGIKELSTSAFLLLSAALLARVLPRLAAGRAVLGVPLALAATFASLTLVSLPWLGVLAAGSCVTAVLLRRSWHERLAALAASAQMGALAIVLSLPTAAASAKLLPAVKGAGPVDLGNLGVPVPGIAATGVWITGDIRFSQYAHAGISEALGVLVLLLAAIGFVSALKRRAWSVVWLAIAGAVALYYVAHRYGPWIQLKADCLTASISLLLAFAGIGALMRSSRRALLLAALPALAVAGGVLAGNALLYHDVTLSPYGRLHNLQYIGERFARQGPTLTPDFEEYTEYYLRDADQTSVVNGPGLGLRAGVNRAAEPGGLFAYDMNEFSLSFLEGYRTIVMRRNPLASRPPSNFHLAYLSRYYEVWQRVQPASSVYAHLVGGETIGAPRRAFCASVVRAARKAGPGARVAYTPTPAGYIQIDSSNSVLSGGFHGAGGPIIADGQGKALRRQPIPQSGSYELYLGGSIGRPVQISIDGRHVGSAAYEVSYPGQWFLIGSARLSRGPHQIEISRGGISLHPGNGDGVDGFNRTIGPLIIAPAQPSRPALSRTGLGAFATICHSRLPLRWAEVVRPS